MEPEHKPSNSLFISAGVLAVVAAMIAGVAALQKNDAANSAPLTDAGVADQVSATATPSAGASAAASAGSQATAHPNLIYTDGTYSANASYRTPGGIESIGVTLTVRNDVVTSSTVTSSNNDHDSRQYQAMFVGGYKQYVVGKKLADIQLTRVSGSSLTPMGFNSALSDIQSQAQKS